MASEAERIAKGLRFRDRLGDLRVMAVAEGYAMVRRPHAIPFIMTVKEVAALRDRETRDEG